MVGLESSTQLDWDFDPLEALGRWPVDRKLVMLHSGRVDRRWARWSVLAEPVGFYQLVDHTTEHQAHPGHRIGQSRWLGDEACPVDSLTHTPFADLRALIKNTDGLWIGYLSYDLGRWIEQLPSIAQADRNWPIIELGYCPGWLVWDGVEKTWTAHGRWAHDSIDASTDDTRDGPGPPDLSKAKPTTDPNSNADPGAFCCGQPESVFTRDEYEKAVGDCLNYIAAGDVFQVNLSQRFSAPFQGVYPQAQRALFRKLASGSPAWYGAYLELAQDSQANQEGDAPQRVIASTSPELFLEVDADGKIITRPIKGTRPAGVDAKELRDSEKDRAELNMIVDLMRNDLGRVCEYGSVKVTDPRTIETHPTVHHGVATIEAKLRPGKDVIDLLEATLPGGSITGAPKVRTMQIIEQLEPVRRGPYCGCIGMLGKTHSCLNIAIRTMLIESFAQEQGQCEPGKLGRVDFGVGGGIVADSDPASEYRETLDKAQAMLTALGAQRPDLAMRT